MRVCLVCRYPHFQSGLSCTVCGGEEFFIAGEVDPGDLALRLVSEGRHGEAYASLEDLVARGEETAEDCVRLAWLGFAFDDHRAVETWCHEAERLAPGWAEPHVVMGWALERAGRWVEALEEYDAALRRGVEPGEREDLVKRRRVRVEGRIPRW